MEMIIKNLSYKNIFSNLNLKISENKVTLLAGSSCCGKTIISNLLYGLYQDYKGEILLDNCKISQNDISYLTQNNSMLFNINLKEDIIYNLKNYNEDELIDMLKMFDLDKSILNKNYLEISKSEYRKICIISCLLKNSKVIILDEPTIGLDEKSIQSLIKLIKHKKRKNNIIIVISNNSDFLIQIIDNVIILDRTNPLEINNKYEFFKNKKLLNKINMKIPNVVEFNSILLKEKNIRLYDQDNISDLLKEIYRNASKNN